MEEIVHVCAEKISSNQYSTQVKHMPEREAVLFALQLWYIFTLPGIPGFKYL